MILQPSDVLPPPAGVTERDLFVHLVAQAAVVQNEDIYPDAGAAVDLLLRTFHRRLADACLHVGDTISGVRPAATELVQTWWDAPAENPAKTVRPMVRHRNGASPSGLSVCTVSSHGLRRTRISSERVGKCLLVHPSLRSEEEVLRAEAPSSWAITHCPTGMLLATVGSQRWARFLAKQVSKLAGPALCSWDLGDVQRMVAGNGGLGTAYIVAMTDRSFDPDAAMVPFSTWARGRTELNPQEQQDIKNQAAVAAALGSFIGGLSGAVVGLVAGASLGALAGVALGGVGGAAATGASVAGLFGIPLGFYVGTIWGAVRRTGRAVKDASRGSAMLAAGVGAAFMGPLGAGLGGYLGA